MKNLQRLCFRESFVPAKPGDDLPLGVQERYGIAYWFEFEDECLYLEEGSMRLYRCAHVPEDARPVPMTDDELNGSGLPRSFVGTNLVSIEYNEPYLMRFSNGGIIDMVFDYRYFTDGPQNCYPSPEFTTPAWLAAPENAEARADFEEPAGDMIDLRTLPAVPQAS